VVAAVCLQSQFGFGKSQHSLRIGECSTQLRGQVWIGQQIIDTFTSVKQAKLTRHCLLVKTKSTAAAKPPKYKACNERGEQDDPYTAALVRVQSICYQPLHE